MKILRPGRSSSEWSREVTCTGKGNAPAEGCDALLLVSAGDVFKSYSRAHEAWFATIECPECGTLTDICYLTDWRAIPSDVSANLMPYRAWAAHQVANRESVVNEYLRGNAAQRTAIVGERMAGEPAQYMREDDRS